MPALTASRVAREAVIRVRLFVILAPTGSRRLSRSALLLRSAVSKPSVNQP
jgi:hypothetical protein